MKSEEYTTRVKQCDDGKYRWTYEVNLYRNPTILIDLLKIVVGCLALPYLLIDGVIVIKDFGMDKEWFVKGQLNALIGFGGIILFMVVLSVICYYWWAASLKGRYIASFVMDETGIEHHLQKRSNLVMAAALVSNNPSTIAAASVTSWKSEFWTVRRVIPIYRRDRIKVTELLTKNRIYVLPQDYEFILNYITQHCPRLKI